MIVALLLLQALGAVPGFETAPPLPAERIALPHVADALGAATPAERTARLDTAIALLPAPTRFRGAVQCVRGATMLSSDPVGSRAAGLAAIDECFVANPDVPLARRMKADAAFFADDWRGGATLLTEAIRQDPRVAWQLDEDRLATIFRRLGYASADAERRALVVALARTDVARANAELYSGWVREALLDRIATGDLNGAATLLPYVVDPADALTMIVDRRYAPLWPRIDEWARGDLVVQRDAMLAAARASYAADPRLGRAWRFAGTLARTGHADEGVALLDRAIAAFGPPRDDYDYARGAVRLASLTAQAGERDPARILAPLHRALSRGVAGPMLITVVPNLAMAQIALGQPAAAIATLDRFPTDPGKVEAREAYGYFVALRGCAHARLGQAAQARAAFAQVTRTYAANRSAVDLATMCIGSDAQVLAYWIGRVDDPDTRSDALRAMYAARMGVEDDPFTLAPRGLRAIAGRAEVSAKLAHYGRDPAPSYLPAMRGWRAPR